ncbi:frizzled-3-like isoform X1 [Sebastes umbrosus]|uniref:frizzled-3-like isoform X1 n=1 Tax=Sebastes umbrosus TaxID=72105 RepID=UPI00189F06A7|nr:frizzled-3-like isoform X1 [Sebastes umbrosus]XP_037646972.1 frizzled-3-like isoform X1 [Sebastes umbrosus]
MTWDSTTCAVQGTYTECTRLVDFLLFFSHKKWTQLLLMLRSFKNQSCMSSGRSGDDKVIRLSHCGEMSNTKMVAPVGRGCMKDWFSKTTTIYCRQQVPVCFSVLIPIFLLLFSVVTPALSIHVQSIESHSEFSCEPIRLRMCQDLPYNTTFMPNLLNHYDQQTAALAMEPFHPMVNLVCSADLRMFLCALYAPICAVYGQVSMPCRSLCQRAKDECHKLMEVFGVAWPDDMECSRFPDCDEPYPRPEDLLTGSDPTDQSSMTVQRDYGFWCPRELKVDPDLGYTFMGKKDCSAPCPSMFFNQQELKFIRYFIGVVSIVCLSATLFTFLTFLIDVTRFRYPERPIIFYAVCYVMVSLVFFLGFLLEDRVACNAVRPSQFRASTITQGSHNKVCTLFFMVLYFFTMAGSVWWVILTITWFLAAVPKWGSEAIEKKALLFHAVAWGLPGALTVTLLALNKIEGDGISGVCFIGLYDIDALRWFVLAPLCLNVAVGVSLLLVGIVALNRVRMEIPLEKENQTKLVKFMIRMGVFSVLYLVPLLTVIGCYLYEHTYRSIWETTWMEENCKLYHIPCPYKVEREVDQTSRPAMVLFLIKYLMMLVVGIPSVFWVGSKKTCFEWANFLHGRRRKDSGVNESRQVLQEQPDFAQSLLREPNTPIVRKSRGTSTQGTSTHASSTHLAVLDDLDEPVRTHHPTSTKSKASSLHSKTSYHGSLRRTRDDRSDTMVYRGTEERSFHGSMPRIDHPLSAHSSLHQIDGHSRHGSQRDVAEAPPTLITHGTTGSDSQAPENDGTSA